MYKRQDKIRSFLEELNQRPSCMDPFNPQRRSSCTCLSGTFTEEMKTSVVDELFKFSLLDYQATQLLVLSWIRYADVIATMQRDRHLVYILPGTNDQLVCRPAIATLVGFGKKAWYRVVSSLREGTSIDHGLQGKTSNHADTRMQEHLHDFFSEMTEHATPRATRIVRQHVVGAKDAKDAKAEEEDNGSDLDADDDLVIESLRDTDVDVVDLPPSFSKRGMYKRFLAEQMGWTIAWDSTGRIISTLPVAGMEQVEPVPSWGTFLGYWNSHFPKMRIQRPKEDICGQCYTFANSFKFKKRKARDGEGDDDSSEDDDDDAGGTQDIILRDAAKYTNERLVLEAAKHVKMAKIQRDLYNLKKKQAQEYPDKVRTCTIDYAQNTLMPHFGDEQPGKTYYYSPVNVYTLGVVNCGLNPMRLYAHTYFEDEAKKGGNNVASLIYRQLFYDGFLQDDKKHIKELNFVFDNCGGQNKNRMVLRMLLYLVRRKVCDTARAIFLIKGHTKNDCDRMFNLMKKEYRKKNSYTPKDVLENLNQHKDVTVLRARVNHFCNWDKFFDQYMNKTEKVKKNHIFTCTALEPFALQVQEHWEAPITKQNIVKRHSVATDWGNPSNKPEVLQHPGMKDIKYKELHDKWRPLIPLHKRDEYKYYKDDPGEEIRGKVKANKKAAKAARAGRTASNVEDVKLLQQPKTQNQASSTTGII